MRYGMCNFIGSVLYSAVLAVSGWADCWFRADGKAAQLSAADTVESIAPPILSHILTAYNNCVPGKGELEGEKRASQLWVLSPSYLPMPKWSPWKEKMLTLLVSSLERKKPTLLVSSLERKKPTPLVSSLERKKSTPLVSSPRQTHEWLATANFIFSTF